MGDRPASRTRPRAARAVVGTSGDDPATSDRSAKPQLDLFDAPEEPTIAPKRQEGAAEPDKAAAVQIETMSGAESSPPNALFGNSGDFPNIIHIHVGDRPRPAKNTSSTAAQEEADFDLSGEGIGHGGLSQKYRDNIAALRILKSMAAESRKATPEERKTIARYVGWGALKGVFDPDNKQWTREHSQLRGMLTEDEWKSTRASMLNAHYTSPVVVDAIYEALGRLGFRSGRVLEPSVGVGNFFGLMPADMRKGSELHGVEIEPLTASIAAALYPSAKIANKGFQDYDIPSGYFDAAVGNPPFGNTPLADMHGSPYSGLTIHNYFFAKAIDKLRDGGLLAMVCSRYFMDAREPTARRWISERAELVSAVRLPNTAFKENAGTEVVTDILVFRKLGLQEATRSGQTAAWIETGSVTLENEKTGENAPATINTYFINNPSNVLGILSMTGTMYRLNDYTVTPDPSRPLEERLAEWAGALPAGIYMPVERGEEMEAADVAVPDGVKEGSFFVAEDGSIMVRGSDKFGKRTAERWDAPNAKAAERVKGMIRLRDGLRQQMRIELSPASTPAEIEHRRTILNRDYDAFRKSFGFVWDAANRRLFKEDTESPLVLALEFEYDKGVSSEAAARDGTEPRKPSARKADILRQRVLFPPQDNIHVESARDALLASLNYRGKIDMPYMESIYLGKAHDEIVEELGKAVFNDPLDGLVLADEYLSGDVKTKLENAKAAATDNPAYRRNVAALEEVIPADKRPSEINATLGAAFIPPEIFAQFGKHVTGIEPAMSYIRSTGQWTVRWSRDAADPTLNVGKFGTTDAPATSIFQNTLEGRGTVVTRTITSPDGTKKTEVKENETEAAREKQRTMKDEWKRWLWADPERAIRIANIYNEKLNRIVPRRFDGAHLTLPGMSPVQKLNPHQKNAVWRCLQSRQVLLDHAVGAGKTAVIVSTMMEMRRMGIARKPVIAVPNHLTLQWQGEFSKFYPAARVLAATPDDFSKGNREKFFSKIITGDWDAVIIGHSSLKKIGLPPAVEQRVLNEQIEELSSAIEELKRHRGDRHVVRDMEKIKAGIEAKMVKQLHEIGSRDKALTFDEIGIDAFAVDELHEFKNLFYNTSMDRVPGMGNPSGSNKAFDLFVKTQWMWETFGDKAVFIGATGTPISNSMVEMFNLQRYMQYPKLKELGLNVFDPWARQFATAQSVYEVSPSGTGYRQSSRLEFTGINALMPLFHSFTDTVTLEQLQRQAQDNGSTFPVPKIAGGQPKNIVARRSSDVADFMGVPQLEIGRSGMPAFGYSPASGETARIERSKTSQSDEKWSVIVSNGRTDRSLGSNYASPEAARQAIIEAALSPVITVAPNSILGQFNNLRQLTQETKGKINALSLTGLANKAGLDFRLIKPDAPDFHGSKTNLAVEQMLRIYRKWDASKGSQLVFCDMSIPLSGRRSLASKDARTYVRNSATGTITHKRGTLHTAKGHEGLPYLIVKEGGVFSAYDAASGVFVTGGATKEEARQEAEKHLRDDTLRAAWIERREAAGSISQEEIDDYNAANEFDENAEGAAISMGDIASVSGAAGFSVYDDIKAKLVTKGIPSAEVSFIHDYQTPAAKDKLFKAVNCGNVRILLGSTAKMGAGTNVQERLVGLHHIDAPWRPSDLEQREGRIVRQGNKLYERDPEGFEVEILRYATEQTYDTRRWQILEHKARMIAQVRSYDGTADSIEDIGAEAANASEMKAAASGDPLILEETRLRNEVKRLEKLQAAHADEANMLMQRAYNSEQLAFKTLPALVKALQESQRQADQHPVHDEGAFQGIDVDGKNWTDREHAIDAIKAKIVETYARKSVSVFVYRGVPFALDASRSAWVGLNSPTEQMDYFKNDEIPSAQGFITRFSNYINKLPQRIGALRKDIEKETAAAAGLRKQALEPFGKTDELNDARNAYRRVQRQLIAKGPEVPPHQKQVLDSAMRQQHEYLVRQGFGDALGKFLGEEMPTHSIPQQFRRSVLPLPTQSCHRKQYQTVLDRYIVAKHDQASRINTRLTEQIQAQRLKISEGTPPNWLSLHSTKQAWEASQAQKQARLMALQTRMAAVRGIEEGMSALRTKIEELALKKMRTEHPVLFAEREEELTLSRRSRPRQGKSMQRPTRHYG
ncbi:MAG: DEAD/DEAH box helicase family protein [Azoarcus sp.]|nr:DEAD/DEAH box helicase family protein [Azoarcus sp.]